MEEGFDEDEILTSDKQFVDFDLNQDLSLSSKLKNKQDENLDDTLSDDQDIDQNEQEDENDESDNHDTSLYSQEIPLINKKLANIEKTKSDSNIQKKQNLKTPKINFGKNEISSQKEGNYIHFYFK
jgi:hypothetical protein